MRKSYLVVEATLLIKELKVFAVRFATPKVEVTNFEVTPDCEFSRVSNFIHVLQVYDMEVGLAYSGIGCRCFHRRLR